MRLIGRWPPLFNAAVGLWVSSLIWRAKSSWVALVFWHAADFGVLKLAGSSARQFYNIMQTSFIAVSTRNH
jgi:hypothetical protein